MKSESTFFILAGEQSADNHGAVLMQSIRTLNPHAKFRGIGGKKMIETGLKSLEDIDKLAIMGFVEVIMHLSFFKKLTPFKNKALMLPQNDLKFLVLLMLFYLFIVN